MTEPWKKKKQNVNSLGSNIIAWPEYLESGTLGMTQSL
jgi:hypothetical protein